MNKDMYKAKWRQFQGRTRIWRGKLTGRRVDRVAGRLDLIRGKVQERYSVLRSAASSGIERRLGTYRTRRKQIRSGSKSK